MSELSKKTNLFRKIDEFVENDCINKKLEPFKINFLQGNETTNIFPIIYDDSTFIQCIMKIPKEQYPIINYTKKPIKILINDSSFDLVFFKNDKEPTVLKFLLFIIIKDISNVDKEESTLLGENVVNANEDEDIIYNLKSFLFDIIDSKKDIIHSYNEKNIHIVDKLLFEENIEKIKFFNNKTSEMLTEEDKNNIMKIKFLNSNIEIIEKNATQNEIIIKDVLNYLNPSIKEDLINGYNDEMPEEIAELIKNYHKIYINNNMYLNYLKSKNDIDEDKISKEDNDEMIVDEKKKNKKGSSRSTNKKTSSSSQKKQMFNVKA